MFTDLKVSAMLIAGAIIVGSFLDRTKPEYHYEIHGDRAGFTVRINKTSGQRCLLNEGAVRVVGNWRDMAREHPVPLNICKDNTTASPFQ